MQRERKRRPEYRIRRRVCLLLAVALAALVLSLVYFWNTGRKNDMQEAESETETETENLKSAETEESLTQPEDLLPRNLTYQSGLPVTDFYDESGNPGSLTEYQGKLLVLIFWGSWCPDCDGMLENLPEYQAVLEENPQAELLLIDRLSEEKGETVEKAREHLREKEVTAETWYDRDETAWQAYGMRQIPTMLILDEEGKLQYMTTDLPESRGEFQGALDYAGEGGDSATLSYITGNLLSESGGVATNAVSGQETSPAGTDVLSESQGLLMEYAALTGNQELFDTVWTYTREQMEKEGTFVWYVTEDGEQASANALLDDLRIFSALGTAEKLWGGYADELQTVAEAVLSHNLTKKGLTDFYDFGTDKAGTSISLCQADFSALDALAEYEEEAAGLSEQLLQIVESGYLGDDFPVYAASYDYKKKRWSTEELNAAEMLMTLYHLAQAGSLKETSHQWLLKQLQEDTLGARYLTDGTVAEGYAYDSTAVYGLAALIGLELEDDELFSRALYKMELARVQDADSALYGSFCRTEDGSDITAFDQLIPLLVYAKERE